MREIKITRHVYKYSELPEHIKAKIRDKYIDETRTATEFKELCREQLKELFPLSNLEIQFSLSYCQGDGVNIYGNIDLNDLLCKGDIKSEFYCEDLEFISRIIDAYGSSGATLEYNRWYAYCLCNKLEFAEEIIDTMRCNKETFNKKQENALYRFEELSREYLCELCSEFEEEGYNYFYEEVSDEEVNDWAESNDFEFYENGTLYEGVD